MHSPDSKASLKLEQMYDRFELAWQSDQTPKIEDFLIEVDEVYRKDAFKELLRIEIEIRQKRGESLEQCEFFNRFPSLQSTIASVFDESEPTDTDSAPQISGFQLIARLGAGGQGEVWLAMDSKIERLVAIKILNARVKESQAAVARFRHEAKVTARLEHPNVVPVYEILQELSLAGKPKLSAPCFVMKVYGDRRVYSAIAAFHLTNRPVDERRLVEDLLAFNRNRSDANRQSLQKSLDVVQLDESRELDRRLKSQVSSILERESEAGSLTKAIAQFHLKPWSETALRKLLSNFLRVCDAVGYAHSRGVIHCDLKPDNVMLGEFGETLVADWGLAREVVGFNLPTVSQIEAIPTTAESPGVQQTKREEEGIAGTIRYMSPEQADGKSKLGPATDIFSLGAVLYCILTGQAPIGSTRPSLLSTDTTTPILSDRELYAKACQGEFLHPLVAEPRTPKALAAIAVKAMEKEISKRYTTALDLASDVEKWLKGDPVSAWREPISVRIGRWAKCHETAVVAIIASMLVGILSMSLLFALVNAQKFEISGALGRETQERQRAVDALELAEVNSQKAKEQSQLALQTLTSIVTELQRSFVNLPGGATVRSRILSSSLPYLDKVASEFTSKATVDRITMIALGELGDTLLEIGKLDSRPECVHPQPLSNSAMRKQKLLLPI